MIMSSSCGCECDTEDVSNERDGDEAAASAAIDDIDAGAEDDMRSVVWCGER